MPTALTETLPLPSNGVQWQVWGTTARVLATDPAAAAPARALVEPLLAAVDAAGSRFRPDSEIRAVAHAGGAPVTVSPLLAELVAAALDAARVTGGDVDPTVASAVAGLGYDRDLAQVEDLPIDLPGSDQPGAVQPGAGTGVWVRTVHAVPGWRRVRLDGRRLSVRGGAELDLGATAKAFTADRAAALVAERLGVGVLVSLGGDIATAGPAPAGGWKVLVQDRPGEPADNVALPAGTGLATSSTIGRSWRRGDELLHHIVDPRTGRSAAPAWRTASVAATSCLAANTYSTAALVRGLPARSWLIGLGMPARLVGLDGAVLRLGSWPPLDGGAR